MVNLLGWALIIIGLCFLLLGLVAAARKVLKKEAKRVVQAKVAAYAATATEGGLSVDRVAVEAGEEAGKEVEQKSYLQLAIDLIKALTEAPEWLALTLIGLFLIVYGSRLAEIIVATLGP
jgi:hypothetical protein